MTPDRLSACTKKRLESLARRHGIVGRHQMRKAELIDALLATTPDRRGQVSRAAGQRNGPSTAPNTTVHHGLRGAPRRLAPSRAKSHSNGTAVAVSARESHGGDLLQLTSLNRHWALAKWQVSSETRARVMAAMGPEWHTATPVLRVLEFVDGDGGPATQERQQIVIGDPVQSWFVHRTNEEARCQVHLGYLTRGGRFHAVLRSGILKAGTDLLDESLEERSAAALHERESGEDSIDVPRYLSPGVSVGGNGVTETLSLAVEAELVIRGRTRPGSALRMQGRPVALSRDGQFAIRVPLTPGRHVIPTVATSPDCDEERTVLFAIEVSTRELGPRDRP